MSLEQVGDGTSRGSLLEGRVLADTGPELLALAAFLVALSVVRVAGSRMSLD